MEHSIYEIKSYVPEMTALEGKDMIGARLCTEDCAVLDPSRDLLILQSRGIGLLPDTPLAQAIGMTAEESDRLMEAVRTHHRFFISAGNRPLLIFADWLSSTGLLLAILPHSSSAAVQKALSALQRDDIVCPFPISDRASAQECRRAKEQLDEILRYADCMLAKSLPQAHLFLVLATFSGCHLEIPSDHFSAFPEAPLGDRMTALLFCALLYIRGIAGTAKHESVPHCRLTLSYRYPSVGSYTPPPPTFLEAACFADCHVQREGGQLAFVIPTGAELSTHAASDSPMHCIVLEYWDQ